MLTLGVDHALVHVKQEAAGNISFTSLTKYLRLFSKCGVPEQGYLALKKQKRSPHGRLSREVNERR